MFIEALQNALASAYKKQYESGASIVEVKLNPEKSTIKFYTVKTAVAEVEDKEKEISLAEAQLIKKSYKLGDVLRKGLPRTGLAAPYPKRRQQEPA